MTASLHSSAQAATHGSCSADHFALFFSSEREFDDLSSDDQEFGIHTLAIAPNGQLLLTYDVDLLSPNELSGIERWITHDP